MNGGQPGKGGGQLKAAPSAGNFLKGDTSDRVKKEIAKGDLKKSDRKELLP